MNNNILRTGKVKTIKDVINAIAHNLRMQMQGNIDAKKSHLNQVLVNSLNADLKSKTDFSDKLSEHYKSLGVQERSDNVRMMEFVVSASPEFFRGMPKAKIEEWANSQVDFMKKEFGAQLKLAVLHLDEKTPHLHIMIGTELKSIKKYKNRYGTTEKESWSLNAKRYGKQFLIDLHTRHAEHNEKFGLKRGVRGSMKNHTSLKEYYKMVDKALSTDYELTIEKVIDSLETGYFGKVSLDELREKFKPMLNTLLRQNKALKEKFSIEIKELAEKLAAREIELTAKEAQLNLKQQSQNLKFTEIDKLRKEKESQAKQIEVLTLQNEELIKQLPKPKLASNHSQFLKKA